MIHTSCSRCNQPLAAESASGLCPTCHGRGIAAALPATLRDGLAAPGRALAQPGSGRGGGSDTRGPTAQTPSPNDKSWPKLPAAPEGYELIRRLGSGGMGDVYLARELTTERLVAMKFLRHAGDQSAFDRFLVELRSMAGVDHPGVVRVFASDFMRTNPYFTMEYVPGDSLGARLVCTGPFDPREAARLIAGAARAVHAAHEAGVIHRDLKPSNILVGAGGTPKVADFGLAKRTDHDDGLTTTSGPVGTPAYMAPEQTSRHYGSPGRRADVYGLGATLYHLITGRPPFSGSPVEVVARLLTATPDRPRSLDPEIPAGLEAVVMKCLEKEPGGRYATAAELADDLDRFLAGKKPDAPAMTWPRRAWRAARPRLAPVAMVAALLLGVFRLGAAGRPSEPKPNLPVDPVEEARKELAAGRPVNVLDKTGNPKYSRWLLGTSTFGQSPHDDPGVCYFPAQGFMLLEMFPAPGISSYRIDLELRQINTPPIGPINPYEFSYLGAYFGYEPGPLPDGIQSHKMFALTYRDSDRVAFLNGRPPEKQRAILQRFNVHQWHNFGPSPNTAQLEGLEFTPKLSNPGHWRPIRIECSPDRIAVYWRDDNGKMVPVADWKGQKVLGQAAALRTDSRVEVKNADAGWWNPNAPFGLMTYSASVAFKHVVITPLPRAQEIPRVGEHH